MGLAEFVLGFRHNHGNGCITCDIDNGATHVQGSVDGKYERQTSRLQRHVSTRPHEQDALPASPAESPVDLLYEKLVEAHHTCNLRPPNRDQVINFLAKQQETIKQRFGDKPVDFVVVTEEGKPRVRVRAKD